MSTYWEQRFARRMGGVTSSAIRELFKAVQQPGMISFAGGMPAPETLPTQAISEASQRVLAERGQQALQYGSTEVYPPLRTWIAEYMAQHGVSINEDNVLITSGGLQGLDLASRVLLNPGDRVLVESPTFLGALQVFNAYEISYVVVPLDEDGLQVEPLEAALEVGPRFIYAVPTFQNPAGVTLSPERRRVLVELAAQAGVPILEDDPYRRLRYEGQHPPLLLALDAARLQPGQWDSQGNVIYCGSFSKLLGPGLRLGWVVAPAVVIRRMVQAKQGNDLHSSLYVQMVVHEAVRGGFLEQHVPWLQKVYRERRDVMLEAMARYFPPGVSWTRPEGGLFVWASLPSSLNIRELFEEALHHQVAFVPSTPFYADQSGPPAMRLNFSYPQPEQIETGIERLGVVLAQALER
jgi:2-aminoadipate transaminase